MARTSTGIGNRAVVSTAGETGPQSRSRRAAGVRLRPRVEGTTSSKDPKVPPQARLQQDGPARRRHQARRGSLERVDAAALIYGPAPARPTPSIVGVSSSGRRPARAPKLVCRDLRNWGGDDDPDPLNARSSRRFEAEVGRDGGVFVTHRDRARRDRIARELGASPRRPDDHRHSMAADALCTRTRCAPTRRISELPRLRRLPNKARFLRNPRRRHARWRYD